jgi:pimeloyl-ACP methyl ester carboxylesterase
MHQFDSLTYRLMTSPLGNQIAKPWLDELILLFLKHGYFPLSRLWAAARAADGDVERFIEAVPLHAPNKTQRKRIRKALAGFERARLRAFSVEQLWRHYFFGEATVSQERLLIVEDMRLELRSAYNATRRLFLPLHPLLKTSVAMNPPTPEQLAVALGDGDKIDELFTAPDSFPEVEVSRSIPSAYGRDYWIRFDSPHNGMNDSVYARVHEPSGVSNPPTLIFGHGICVDFDHYRQLLDEVTYLTKLGIRVIRPEAPWHGRRVLPGHYGGEQLLSGLPLSMFDFISAQHKEWACIIDWCRSLSDAPVAIGGSSLGAQSAKAVAMHAKDWPEKLQADALFVVTHSQNIFEAALDGALSDIWNFGAALRAKGWHQHLERQWLARIDPPTAPCMPGNKVVTVYGKQDKITPIKTAKQQMDAWQVPEQNRFEYRRGHFTIPLGMVHDRAPLIRLADILHNRQ